MYTPPSPPPLRTLRMPAARFSLSESSSRLYAASSCARLPSAAHRSRLSTAAHTRTYRREQGHNEIAITTYIHAQNSANVVKYQLVRSGQGRKGQDKSSQAQPSQANFIQEKLVKAKPSQAKPSQAKTGPITPPCCFIWYWYGKKHMR